ncbi:hypothetical protein AUEXF2481DRAFT_598 [Aureobasidium subglaciale EXF-2481]|uniref:Uncharacterized protein n=1 Tax=Aureobasidium subglaciale (strain EXF-2481) TaxID=1043005 RepID=A0A074YX22_AURSE|nr:uncharacterized protein AUEXF2481DRAFT_598 [Aureobasidium subglaciale EXF-2481]KAI5210313.1 hypothetical protein E4T38_02094 [Aureobasidium subglaciale]KAI5229036.1 hypothetical protein E4T40_01800 [Aureobasidium subglaciale]KAI5232738.1 hypothetical protein E4T41_02020 [Aureobasidium subglaciale]KAI5266098.1 hypothetical protein E4T46_01871 [Aureobasidium subglaciale]KER00690.1 hypothetical protein AUEXF2481DRAFT_598 [Aureobasidium subglaciale EXF-2481]
MAPPDFNTTSRRADLPVYTLQEGPYNIRHTMLSEEGGRENFLENLCPHLGGASDRVIKEAIKMFARVGEKLGKDIAEGIKNHKEGKTIV